MTSLKNIHCDFQTPIEVSKSNGCKWVIGKWDVNLLASQIKMDMLPIFSPTARFPFFITQRNIELKVQIPRLLSTLCVTL